MEHASHPHSIASHDAPGPLARLRARLARIERRTLQAIVGVALLLIAARIALPYVLEHLINERLAQLDGYFGHVEDVDVALIRGAYRLEGLRIVKTGENAPREPFFDAPVIDVSLAWGALFDGKVVAEIELDRPALNFAVGNEHVQTQAGQGTDWRQVVDDMVPITIERFVVHGGEVHYRDYSKQPIADLRADRIELVARHLSNERREGEELPARVHLDARVQQSGSLVVDARLAPLEPQPDAAVSLRLRDLPATELNPMLRAYVGVDAEEGQFFLYSRVRVHDGRFRGFVKPMFEGLTIFEPDEESSGPLDWLGDAFVGLVQEIFSNQGSDPDRLATRIPLSGSIESPQTDAWAAVWVGLYNAFVEALAHGFADRDGWGPDENGEDENEGDS